MMEMEQRLREMRDRLSRRGYSADVVVQVAQLIADRLRTAVRVHSSISAAMHTYFMQAKVTRVALRCRLY